MNETKTNPALPEEIWLRIFSFCGLRDRGSVAQVCSNWQRMVSDRAFLKADARRLLGMTLEERNAVTLNPSAITWNRLRDMGGFHEIKKVLGGCYQGKAVIVTETPQGLAIVDFATQRRVAFLDNGQTSWSVHGWLADLLVVENDQGALQTWEPVSGTLTACSIQADRHPEGQVVPLNWFGEPSLLCHSVLQMTCAHLIWPLQGGAGAWVGGHLSTHPQVSAGRSLGTLESSFGK